MSDRRLDLVAVVDHDAVSLQAMLRALRGLDCRVIGFGSAPLALAHILQRRFDLVVDVQCGPRCQGRTLGGALRTCMGPMCPTLVLVHPPETEVREASDYDVVLTTPVRVLDLLVALDLARLDRTGT